MTETPKIGDVLRVSKGVCEGVVGSVTNIEWVDGGINGKDELRITIDVRGHSYQGPIDYLESANAIEKLGRVVDE